MGEKKLILGGIVSALALCAGVYFALIRAPGDGGGASGVTSGGVMAPTFKLQDAGGKDHSLGEFKGRPIVVHFWASWCAPCLDEIPKWLEAAKTAEGRQVAWLAISLDTRWDAAHKILPDSALEPHMISVIDSEQKVSEQFGSFQFPESYLVDREGRVAHKWVGPQEWATAVKNLSR